jgi:hypothetical protein
MRNRHPPGAPERDHPAAVAEPAGLHDHLLPRRAGNATSTAEERDLMIAPTAVDLIEMGNLALQQGNVVLACRQYEESLVIWRTLDDGPSIAHTLGRLRMLELNPASTSNGPAQSLAHVVLGAR